MLFSIVIPLYNKAHTIISTLKSVEKQIFKDFEVVIVNDGSTDNSIEVIKNYNFNFVMKIVNQTNKGVSVARNRGINESEGQYISFLDGDDEWEPDYLIEVEKAISKYRDAGLIITGRYYLDTNSNIKQTIVFESKKNSISKVEFFENPHKLAHISSTTVKKSLVKTKECFIPGQKTNEDFTFLYKIALNTSCVYVGYPLSIYKGNILGQATSVLGEQQRLKDSTLYLNAVINEWEYLERKNKLFKSFLRFEIFHIIWVKLRENKKNYIESFIDNVKYQSVFNKFDELIIKGYNYRYIILCYIMITKIIRKLTFKI